MASCSYEVTAAARSFADEDVEVVEPEVSHHLFELALAVDGTQELGLGEFPDYNGLRIVHRLQDFALFGLEAFQKFLSLAAFE